MNVRNQHIDPSRYWRAHEDGSLRYYLTNRLYLRLDHDGEESGLSVVFDDHVFASEELFTDDIDPTAIALNFTGHVRNRGQQRI